LYYFLSPFMLFRELVLKEIESVDFSRKLESFCKILKFLGSVLIETKQFKCLCVDLQTLLSWNSHQLINRRSYNRLTIFFAFTKWYTYRYVPRYNIYSSLLQCQNCDWHVTCYKRNSWDFLHVGILFRLRWKIILFFISFSAPVCHFSLSCVKTNKK
jgi:hypothetical protein